LHADGSLTYTPNGGFSGSDSFTYHVEGSDANGVTLVSNTVSVSLIVSAGNTTPVAVADNYATNTGTALSVPPAQGVLSNDTDADGNPLTAVKQTDPTNGTLALNANGSFVYTPDPGASGPDSFTYVANDGTANSASATVTIAVNGVPVAANDSNYSTNENVPLTVTAPGVLSNDTDPEGDALTASLVDPAGQGLVNLNTDGSFTYTPGNNFSGTDSFTYRASDGSAESNIATATITVNNVSDTVTILAVQFTNNSRRTLRVRADSSAPDNSVVLTATITGNGGGPITGTLAFNPDPDRQDYAADFRLPNRFVPTSVSVTSSQGGSASASGPFTVAN
jgi:VCBS repeat-containing protein